MLDGKGMGVARRVRKGKKKQQDGQKTRCYIYKLAADIIERLWIRDEKDASIVVNGMGSG